jgi:anaerobic selenocysteine-containing dehydrogenase
MEDKTMPRTDAVSSEAPSKEDVWISTMCRRCQSECGIRVRRVDGVAVKIEGIPGSSVGSDGGVCAKGMVGLQVLYDPNRLKWPLRRTNPEKGIGVDPGWKEISWDEALDEIADRLQKAVDISPSRVMVEFGIINGMQQPSLFLGPLMAGLSSPAGHPIPVNAAGATCGNAGHFINALNYASFVIVPDYKYCDYVLVFGTNHSFGGFQQYANKLAAEAHRRGMKVVTFDPACNGAGSKADEWIPILPGTDGMVALALLHVIVNELGICDAEYLKLKSNAPYLVGQDGHYVRNKETGRPMVWDSLANVAKDFNGEVGDFALEGEYVVDGVPCTPAWTKLVEAFEKY